MDWFPLLSSQFEFVILGRLLLASFLGGLIGLEREIHGRPAGFRTHLLVALGACLMMAVSEHFFFKYGSLDSSGSVRLDPARVAAQIVTGIGFIGAGVILKGGHVIRGLTTAACLWVAAGIGMAVGGGLYFPAVFVTIIALLSLLFLKRLEGLIKVDRYRHLVVHCADRRGLREKLEGHLRQAGWRIVSESLEKNKETGEIRFDLVVGQCGGGRCAALAEEVAALEEVKRVRFH